MIESFFEELVIHHVAGISTGFLIVLCLTLRACLYNLFLCPGRPPSVLEAVNGRSRRLEAGHVRHADEMLQEMREKERLGILDEEESFHSEHRYRVTVREQCLGRDENRRAKDVELRRLRDLEKNGMISEEVAISEYNNRCSEINGTETMTETENREKADQFTFLDFILGRAE